MSLHETLKHFHDDHVVLFSYINFFYMLLSFMLLFFMCVLIGAFLFLINPIDRYPLMFVAERIQRLNHFSECYIKIIVDHNHVDVFVVFPLQQCALFDCCHQIIVLWAEKNIQFHTFQSIKRLFIAYLVQGCQRL